MRKKVLTIVADYFDARSTIQDCSDCRTITQFNTKKITFFELTKEVIISLSLSLIIIIIIFIIIIINIIIIIFYYGFFIFKNYSGLKNALFCHNFEKFKMKVVKKGLF